MKRSQNLQSTLVKDDKAHKKTKLTSQSEFEIPFNDMLVVQLQKFHKLIQLRRNEFSSADKFNIELEVRVGMLIENHQRWKGQSAGKNTVILDNEQRKATGLNFVPGIETTLHKSIQERLHSGVFKVEAQTFQSLRCDSNKNRWEIQTQIINQKEMTTIIGSEHKESIHRSHAGLLSHHYDIRFDLSIEQTSHGVIDHSKWVQIRHKRRTSYVYLSQPSKTIGNWRVDITEVEMEERIGNTNETKKGVQEIEMEIELLPEAMLRWINDSNDSSIDQYTRVLAGELSTILDLLIPFDSTAPTSTSEEMLQLIPTEKIRSEVMKINQSIFQSIPNEWNPFSSNERNPKTTFDFIGSMPVNLTRSNLQNTILMNPYFVTEKSDGIRYLLYVVTNLITKQPMAILIDRSKSAYSIHGGHELGQALGLGTVLDGELVYNESSKIKVFLVFDVLRFEGKNYVMDPFRIRLEIIQKNILSRYADRIEALLSRNQSTGSGTTDPLLLIRKVFLPKKSLGQLIQKILHQGTERIFFDTPRRHHKTDGIIFQPDAPYIISKNFSLLKWKWPELRSIDLQVKVVNASSMSNKGMKHGMMDGGSDGMKDRKVVHLLCSGPDDVRINCTLRGDENIGLGVFDTYRLLADIDQMRASSSITDHHPSSSTASNSFKVPIVEVSYNASCGIWQYLHLRKDKNIPNYIDTVLAVFIENAESISIEELEYILLCKEYNLDGNQLAQKVLLYQQNLLRELKNNYGK